LLKDIAYYYEKTKDLKNAIKLFSQALQSFEQFLSQVRGPADVVPPVTITDFCWARCGVYACKYRRMLAEQSLRAPATFEIDQEIQLAAGELFRLIRDLADSDRKTIESAQERARRLGRRHPDYVVAVTDMVAMVVEAVFRAGDEGLIAKAFQLAQDFVSAPPSELRHLHQKIMQMAASAELNEDKVIDALRRSSFGKTDVPRSRELKEVYTGLCYVTNFVLLKIPKQRAANEFAMRLERQLEVKEAFDRGLEALDLLFRRGEVRDRAEAEYGVASIYAVQGDVNTACEYLCTAINITSPDNSWASEYLNRAKVDSDFFNIRETSAFQNLLSARPSALDVSGG
jgi:tetratricopeptide (TPR) repeat protein